METKTKKGGVYFIRREKTSITKIGRSADVRNRLYALQTASDAKLELLCVLRAESKQSIDWERRLHVLWLPRRVNGEWYDLPMDVLTAVIHREGMAPSYVSGSEFLQALGGKSPGRPPIFEEAMGRFNVTMTRKQRNLLRTIGSGNVSDGIRRLLDWYTGITKKP